jgi:nitrous oxidase accessory protein NosD/PKD repeat protein
MYSMGRTPAVLTHEGKCMSEAMSRRNAAIIIVVGALLLLICALSFASGDSTANTLKVPENYPTIQSALDSAGVGDTILVKRGTFNEKVRINKAIHLQGISPGSTVIKSTRSGAIITLLSPGITISDLEVHGVQGAGSIGIRGNNIMDLRLRNVMVKDCDEGISIVEGNNLWLSRCKVEGSSIVGLQVNGSQTERFEHISVSDSSFLSNSGIGVSLGICRFVTLDRITVTNNAGWGLVAFKVTRSHIRNSTLSYNDIGLRLVNSHGWSVEDNSLRHNQLDGIELNQSGNNLANEIRRNQITDNSRDPGSSCAGISFYGIASSNNWIEHNLIANQPVGISLGSTDGGCWRNSFYLNEISDCIIAIMELKGTGPNTFFLNTFKNNGHQALGLNAKSVFDINGQGNYWSDYTLRYDDAERIGNIWSKPYKVDPSVLVFDNFPLAFPYENERPEVNLWEDRYATIGVPENIQAWATDKSGIELFDWTITPPSGFSFSLDRNEWQIDYTFKNIGTFFVTVTVTDVWGLSASDTIKVGVIDDVPPVAVAGEDIYVDQGEPFTLDATLSSDNHGIAALHWVFDPDGVNRKYTQSIVSMTIDKLGTYIATLFVVDYSGNSATDTLVIHVQDLSSPVAVAGRDTTVLLGKSKTFDGSESYDNVGIVEYRWTLAMEGSMWVYKGEDVTHTFMELGKYILELRVTDAAGHFDIDQLYIMVIDTVSPVASAGDDVHVLMGTEVTFNAAGSTDNVGITVFTWTFYYRIKTYSLAGRTAEWRFDEPGEYQVTLMTHDEAGNVDTDTMIVTVHDSVPPRAKFQTPLEVELGTSFVLDGSASDDNLKVVSYEWKVTHKSVTRTFTGIMVDYAVDDPGAYTVVLTVMDEAGNEDVHSSSFNVPPKATVSEAPGWLMPAMVAVVAVAVLVSYVIGRRRFGKEE